MAYLEDGYQTIISFSLSPNVKFREISITPPGMDGGDAIDITTMRNQNWRTFAPRKLKTLSSMTVTAAYDPEVLQSVLQFVNVNQEITVTHSDGSKWKFWGYVKTFTPGENTEGERPTAEVEIVPTNKDDGGTEIAPQYIPA